MRKSHATIKVINVKKHGILLLIYIIVFVCLQIKETNGLSKNQINFRNLNSTEFINFVKEKEISYQISKICTTDYCDYLRGRTIEESFKIFCQKYETYLTNKYDEQMARQTILKGFPIISINVLT